MLRFVAVLSLVAVARAGAPVAYGAPAYAQAYGAPAYAQAYGAPAYASVSVIVDWIWISFYGFLFTATFSPSNGSQK